MPAKQPAPSAPITSLPDALSSTALFWQPERHSDTAAMHRVPFLFWLADVLRPLQIVQIGLGGGEGYFALCQAVDRLGIGTVCQGWSADLPADLEQHNARHYAAFSRLISGDAAALAEKAAPEAVDLLVIEGGGDASAVETTLTACAPMLGPKAAVLIVGTPGCTALPGMTAQMLALGAEDVCLLIRAGAGDARFAAFAATADSPAQRQPLVALFNRLGHGLRHEARSLAAQDLAKRLAAEEGARAELAAAYADRHRTLSRMQAMVFDLVSGRDAALAAAEEAAQQRADFDLAVSRATSLTQDKLHLESQLALRFRELAMLTAELDRTEKERDAAQTATTDANAKQIKTLMADKAKLAKSLEAEKAKVATGKERLAAAKAQINAEQGKIKKLTASTSWKMTKPLRGITRLGRKLTGRG